MEDNNDTGAVFLDLAKSFNSISHEIFLKKAKYFDLSIYNFTSQIFSRKLNCIKFGIDLADKITIYHAVPQGTVRNSYFSGFCQLTLNADKTEMLFSTNHTNSNPEFSFKSEVIKPAHACRYRGVQNDSNLNFENHLNSVLSIMANTIRSSYLLRNQIPLKVKIHVFESVVLSHLSFSGVFLQTLTAKNINRINRKTNWGTKSYI